MSRPSRSSPPPRGGRAALPLLALFILFLIAASPLRADFTARGTFLYQDRPFDMGGFTGQLLALPVRGADVEVVDRLTGTVLGAGVTGEDGTFAVDVVLAVPRTLYVRCLTSTGYDPAIHLRLRDELYGGAVYALAGPDHPAHDPSTDLDAGTLTALAGAGGEAFNIFDGALAALECFHELAGFYPDSFWSLEVFWAAGGGVGDSYYAATYRRIFLADTAGYDDTVLLHETGHYVQSCFSLCQSPGGMHYLTDVDQDSRLAFSEGWATGFGSAVRLHRGDLPAAIYVRTHGGSGAGDLDFSYEIETPSLPVSGSCSEVAVSAAIWDCFDGPQWTGGHAVLDDDPLAGRGAAVWQVMAGSLVTSERAVAESFWDGWVSLSEEGVEEAAATFARLGMEYREDPFEDGDDRPVGAGQLAPQEPFAGQRLVINEVCLGALDWVELHNSGGEVVDLQGWSVVAGRTGGGSPVEVTLPAFVLPPHDYVALFEGTGESGADRLFLPGQNLPWTTTGGGWCALLDPGGSCADFCRWGDSDALPPAGGQWTGANPECPLAAMNLGRDSAGSDADLGSDFLPVAPTASLPNWLPDSPGVQHHTFYSAGDEDWLRLPAEAGRRYDLEAFNRRSGAGVLLTLYFPDGQTAIRREGPGSGFGSGPRLAWVAPLDGEYLIRLRNDEEEARYGSFEMAATVIPLLPPTFTGLEPGQVGIGAAVPLTLHGEAFVPGLQVEAGSPEVACREVRVIDRQTAIVRVETSATAVPGPCGLTLRGPDGSSTTVSGALEVVAGRGAVVINEVSLQDNWIELHNGSQETVDLSDWRLRVGAGSSECEATLPLFLLAPGDFLLLYDATHSGSSSATELYLPVTFGWVPGLYGYGALLDSGEVARDFLRWDGLSGHCSESPPAGTSWYGENPSSPLGLPSLGRDAAGLDLDLGSDIYPQASTPGAANLPVDPFGYSGPSQVAAALHAPLDLPLPVSGGTPPYAWFVSGGYLPTGLRLQEDGRLAGTPEWGGVFDAELTVVDAGGRSISAPLALEVDAGLRVELFAAPEEALFPAAVELTIGLANVFDWPAAVSARLVGRGAPPQGSNEYVLNSTTLQLAAGQNLSYRWTGTVPAWPEFATGVEFEVELVDPLTGKELASAIAQVLNR